MTLSLTPEIRKFITDKVSSGEYSTPGEFIADAIAAFRERERTARKQARLKREILKGIEQLERGAVRTVNLKSMTESLIAEQRKVMRK